MTLLQIGGRTVITRNLTRYTVGSTDTDTDTLGQDWLVKPPTGAPSGWPGVIFLPGAFQGETHITSDADLDRVTEEICSFGFPVICGDLGGTQRWGHSSGWPYIDQLHQTLIDEYGCSEHRVILAAVSGGGADCMSWAAQNRDKVLGFAGIAPASSLTQLHDDDPLAPILDIAGSIEAAHGGPPPYPRFDPLLLAQSGAFAGMKYRAWYGTVDTVVTPDTVEGVADAIGSTATLVGYAQGHLTITPQIPTINPAGGSGVDYFASWVTTLWGVTKRQRRVLAVS